MDLLTDAERKLIGELGEVWNRLCQVVGRGVTRDADLGEGVIHVHALQQMVMSQAAGRAYPGEFRTLGGTLAPTEPVIRREWGGQWPGGTLGCSYCGLTLPAATEAEADAAWARLAEHACTPAGEAAKQPVQEAVAARAAELEAEERAKIAEYLGEGALDGDEGCCDRPAKGEQVTPSFTEAEWAEVLAEWMATKHSALIGRAWPVSKPEDRQAAAAELARWLIEAAGEILE